MVAEAPIAAYFGRWPESSKGSAFPSGQRLEPVGFKATIGSSDG